MTATVEVLRAEGIGSVRGPRHLRTDVSVTFEAARAGWCWAHPPRPGGLWMTPAQSGHACGQSAAICERLRAVTSSNRVLSSEKSRACAPAMSCSAARAAEMTGSVPRV